SGADDLIVVRLSANQRGKISGTISLSRPDATVVASGNNELILHGQAAHGNGHKGVKFEAHLRALASGGQVQAETNALHIAGADAVTIAVAASTDYNKADPMKPLSADLADVCERGLGAAKRNYSGLRDASVAAHQKLFRRVALDLGPAPSRSTDERLD